MNLITQWMQSDWSRALGWTFVHSLWQIAAIGLLLYIILRLIPGRSAHVRYTISTMAIWMIVLMALSTFIIMLPASKPVAEISGQVILINIEGEYTLTDRISIWLESRMPMMLSIWFGGVILLMLRLAFSLAWVQHMRSVATPITQLQDVTNALIKRLKLKIKPITSESGHVLSPVTIGHIKPVILFPIGIINQLTPQEVEAILTHEIAHIVRRDYLSNLIQSFIETLFYYHPVTWWISNKVRTERENRADDLAVTWCGDHLGYAKALITVQEMQLGKTPSLAVGFASGKDVMLARIQRILHIPYKNHNQMEKTVLISLCSLFFFGFTLNSHTSQEQKKENTTESIERINVIATIPDSIPSKGTYTIHKKTDNQEISIQVSDGDIKELKIDGKEIAPAQFDDYDEVIDELFGSMEAAPSAEGYNFVMPAMPPMPGMPAMPPTYTYSYTMPRLPDMPPMPGMPDMPLMPAMGMNEMEFERMFGDGSNFKILELDNLDHLIHDQMGNLLFLSDTNGPGMAKIIIIRDGDSTVIVNPDINWSENSPAMKYDYFIKDKEEWKEHQEEWKQHQKEWKDQEKEWKQNWEENAQQWKQDWRAQQEEMRAQQENMRGQNDRIREELMERDANGIGEHERAIQEELKAHGLNGERINEELRDLNVKMYGLDERAMENLLRAQELERHLGAEGFGDARVYNFMAPRMNMTDQMIEEGLVGPGEEADILLTPDKLKINGKKMPEEIHEKYLRMYEHQQGVELSGKSRVEFKTKSRRSM